MDEASSPSLEVGFIIDPDYTGLTQLQSVMESTEAKVLGDAKAIERATAGMVNLAGGTVQMRAFGSAATREMENSRRATLDAEKAGERMVRQLQRQTETYGKTASEIRNMRTEQRALAAEGQGLTELADRLRTANAEMNRMERGAGGVAKGSSQMRFAMQGASYQVQDFITQVSMGANPINAFAVQGGQLAGQFSNVESKAGAVARFMIGPWGLAITAATMVMAPFVAKLFEGNDALDDAVDKLKKDAVETANAERAKRIFANTLEGVRDALDRNRQALEGLADAGKTAARQALEASFLEKDRLAGIIRTTNALINQLEVQIELNKERNRVAAQDPRVASSLNAENDAAIARLIVLRKTVADAGGDVAEAERQINEALGRRVVERTEERATALGRIKEKYEGPEGLIELARKQSTADEVRNGTLANQITLLRKLQHTEEDRAREAERAAKGPAGVDLFRSREQAIGIAGKELQAAGMRVDGNVQFGYTGGHADNAYHNRYKLDANVGKGIVEADVPDLKKKFDDLAKLYQSRGFNVIWNRQFYAAGGSGPSGSAKGHENHMDLEAPSAIVGKPTQSSTMRQALAEFGNAAREATDAEAVQAQTSNLYALSKAYEQSGGAALVAAARVKAESAAIRDKADVEAVVAREVGLAIAQRVADAAQGTAAMRDQAEAQATVNAAVAAGTIPAERASELVRDQLADLPLLAAIQAANATKNVDGAKLATDALEAQRAARKRLADEERTAAFNAVTATGSDRLAELREELRLVGATDEARARALTTLRATQEAQRLNLNPEQSAAYIAQQLKIIDTQIELKDRQDAFNSSLSATADHFALIDEAAQGMADTLETAFGRAGGAIGDALTSVTGYYAAQSKLQQEHAAEIKAAGSDQARIDRENLAFQLHSGQLRTEATMDMLGAAKSMFKEHSVGYKAMEAAEKAFALVQAVNTVKNVAAGAAKMFATLGPFAFPAVAAMVAVMAAFGFMGSGNSGTAKAPVSPEDLQKAAGTGSVLGDPTAKSESIARSLDLMSKNSTKGLDASAHMVRSLRNIETGIGDLATAIARSLQLEGGIFDAATMGLGTSSKGISGLFGSTTTKSLYDQGFTFDPATIQQILEGGITGATYAVIEKVKKSSGFLGIGGGTKTSYSTTTGALPDDVSRQMQLVIDQLYSTVVDAAKVLGLDVGEALKTFQVEIGKISFKDMTADEITQQLEAVFSKIGDQMAGFAVDGLEEFQKAGEGLFETLNRLAKDYLTIDAALKSIGMTFGAVGAASIAARESLIELSGGLDAFTDQVTYFYDNFLTGAQQAAFMQAQVDAAFGAIGVAVPATVEEFAALVTGLDLSTEAGQETFAALMAVAPAFYEVATAADQLAQKQMELQIQLLQAQGKTEEATAAQRALALAALDPALQELQKQVWAAQDAAAAAAKAQQLQNDRTRLQVQLLQAQGKQEEAIALQRKTDLAALDPALRALQQQVWLAEDVAGAKDKLVTAYRRESDALSETASKFRQFAGDLKTFRDGLFMGSEAGPSYNQALAKLMAQGGLAAAGDEAALGGGLRDAAQIYLDIANQNAGSLADVQRARALVARYVDGAIGGAEGKASIADQQLAQMKTQVGALVKIDERVQTVAEAIQALNALLAPPTSSTPTTGSGGTPGHRPGREDREKRNEDRFDRLEAGVIAGALANSRVARIFERFDRGGALAVVTDPDAPLSTTGGLELE